MFALQIKEQSLQYIFIGDIRGRLLQPWVDEEGQKLEFVVSSCHNHFALLFCSLQREILLRYLNSKLTKYKLATPVDSKFKIANEEFIVISVSTIELNYLERITVRSQSTRCENIRNVKRFCFCVV